MRSPSFDPQMLRKHLLRHKIATLPELKEALGTTVRIPAKANAVPKGNRTVFRAEAEHYRSVATLAF